MSIFGEHPQWCEVSHETVAFHMTDARAVAHGDVLIEVALVDYARGAGPVVSFNVTADRDTSFLDLTLDEASELFGHLGELLAMVKP